MLVQIRVGGQQARLSDETVPLACGCIGQETTGAGGFGKALRTVPVMLEIAERVRERAAPDAWIVDFTNPVGIVTRALLDDGHRAIGLCNVAIGFQRRFARLFGVEPSAVLVDQVGLNHLTWIRAVRIDGRDVLPELLAEPRRRARSGPRAAAAAARRARRDPLLLPSLLLRARRRARRAARRRVPRAATVAEIERELLEMYRDPVARREAGAARAARRCLLQRGRDGARGIARRRDRRRPGRRRPQPGRHPGLAGRRRRRAAGAHRRGRRDPLPQPPLAPELLGLVQHVAAYERLAVRAALDGDRVTARKALLAHPADRPVGPGRRAGRPPARGGCRRISLASPQRVPHEQAERVLAIDGGNSKTDLVLVSADGELLAHARGPLSSPHHLGVDGCVDVLARLRGEAARAAGLDTEPRRRGRPRICMAGVDFPSEEQELREAVERRGWAARVSIANDTFAVLRAGTERGWGVAVVCGAGINCVGVSPDGRHARFLSLGAITGDWGGGYDVGLAAVSAAARSEDGRGPTTTLERAVPAYFGVSTPSELAEAFHLRRIPSGGSSSSRRSSSPRRGRRGGGARSSTGSRTRSSRSRERR